VADISLFRRWIIVGVLAVAGGLGSTARAGDLRITIPMGGRLTPVQRLNREGIRAVRKRDYRKAEKLFYKAYLLDPGDPFTLNNMGYVSEMQGQLDRAERFYRLAEQESSTAVIDLASSKHFQGQPLSALLAPGRPMQIDQFNIEATRLLAQRRAYEADLLLQQALKADPQNVFALNNMGVAKEMEGEPQAALRYYDEAAGMHSSAVAVIALTKQEKGQPVSEIARASAAALRLRLATGNQVQAQVADLNLQGVMAANRNDLATAAADFRKAYVLDPNNAFTLNNAGYVAEMQGDRETAQFFYARAQESGGASAPVGIATRHSAEGETLFAVSSDSNAGVQDTLAQERSALRRTQGAVALRRRDGSIVTEPTQSVPPASNPPPQ